MKNSRLKYIGIGLGALLLASGLYLFRTYQTTEVVQEIVMDFCELQDIVRIERYKGDLNTFVYKEEWVNEAFPDVAYDQNMMSHLEQQLQEIETTRIIKNVQSLETYGIDEQALHITVYDKLGTNQSYKIGKILPQENAYYVWHVEKEVMGVVPDVKLASILMPASRLIETTFDLTDVDESMAWTFYRADQGVLEYIQQGEVWQVIQPYKTVQDLNLEMKETYLSDLQKILKEELVGVVSDGDYGMDKPTLRIEREHKPYLTIGKKINEDYYVTYKDEPYVYRVASKWINPLLKIEPFEWMKKSVVGEMLLESDAVEWISGNETVRLSGEELLNLRPSLEQLTYHAPIANVALEQNNPREADGILQFIKEDTVIETIEFIPYDPSFSLVRKQGNVEFSIQKTALLNLQKEIQKIVETMAEKEQVVENEQEVEGEEEVENRQETKDEEEVENNQEVTEDKQEEVNEQD